MNNARKTMICLKGPSIHFPAGTQENREILCFVDRASLYNRLNKANFVHNFSYYIIYRVSQEECAKLRESVPYVKVYRYNSKHLCPNLNGYGDNGQRNLKL